MFENMFRHLLNERGLSLRDFAQLAGVGKTTVARFAKQDHTTGINGKMLHAACRILSVTPNDILKYIPEECAK